jgi:hypothetical protein
MRKGLLDSFGISAEVDDYADLYGVWYSEKTSAAFRDHKGCHLAA